MSNKIFTFVIDNPYPYALGVSIILENNSYLSVMKEIFWEDTDEIKIYIERENLDMVTIITSLMLHQTPAEYGSVMSLDELTSKNLHFRLYEGNIITEPAGLTINTFVIFITTCFVIIIIIRRKTK